MNDAGKSFCNYEEIFFINTIIYLANWLNLFPKKKMFSLEVNSNSNVPIKS